MDQPVERGVVKPFPHLQCPAQARPQPIAIDLRSRIGIHNPRHDFRMRIHCHQRHRPPLGILQHGKAARLQVPRTPVQHRLIGEDPGEAVADRLRLRFRAQAEDG